MFSTFSKAPCCFMKSAHDYFIQNNLPLHFILRNQRPVNTITRYLFMIHEYYPPTHAHYLPSGISYLGFLLHGATAHSGPGPAHYQSFTIIFSNTTVGSILWTSEQPVTGTWQHTTLKTETSMPPAGFEHAIPIREWPHTHAWDRAATGIGSI